MHPRGGNDVCVYLGLTGHAVMQNCAKLESKEGLGQGHRGSGRAWYGMR